GEVALMDGAVEALTREGLAVQRAVGVAIEEAADLVLELTNALDRLAHERPGELLVGQPLAALDRVHEMPLDRVARMQRDVVTALHHAGAAAFAEQALGRDRDVELGIFRVRMQGSEQSGAAGSENQHVRLHAFEVHGRASTVPSRLRTNGVPRKRRSIAFGSARAGFSSPAPQGRGMG